MRAQRRVIWDAAFYIFAIAMFAIACLTERPYLAAFWGVLLICEEIRETNR